MLKVSIKDNEQLVHSEGTLELLLIELTYVICVLYAASSLLVRRWL